MHVFCWPRLNLFIRSNAEDSEVHAGDAGRQAPSGKAREGKRASAVVTLSPEDADNNDSDDNDADQDDIAVNHPRRAVADAASAPRQRGAAAAVAAPQSERRATKQQRQLFTEAASTPTRLSEQDLFDHDRD
jgi:hypothetical protein